MPCPHNEISIVQRSQRSLRLPPLLTRVAKSCSVNTTSK